MNVKVPLKKGGLRGMFIKILVKTNGHPSKSPLVRGDFLMANSKRLLKELSFNRFK